MSEDSGDAPAPSSDILADSKPVHVYRYRFVCATLFFVTALVNSFAPNTFVACAEFTTKLYEVERIAINLNSLAYTIMQPIITFPASYVLDQMGLKPGMNMAFVFMIIGYGLRMLINVQFWLFVMGTYLTAFGFIFVMNSPTKFANNWFPVS